MGTVPNYKFVGEYVKSQFERGRNALEEGVYDRAIELFTSALRGRGMNPEIEAEIRCSLSEAYEEDSNSEQALQAISKYESPSERDVLSVQIQSLVWLRMGLAYDRDPRAISYLKTSLKLSTGLSDALAIGQAHLALGRAYLKVDEYHIAHDHLELAAENLRLIGDRRLLAQSYLAKGNILLRGGKHEDAITLLESAERLVSDKPYYSLLGQIMQNRSLVYFFQQRIHEAMEYQERSVAFYERTGQRRYLVAGLNNLAAYLLPLGEADRAEAEWKRAVILARELRQVPTEAMSLDGLAQIEVMRGDFEEAEEKLQSALSLLDGLKAKWYETQVRQSLTRLYFSQGDFGASLIEANKVVSLADQIGDEHGLQLAQLILSEAKIRNNQIDEARLLIDQVEEKLQTDGSLALVGLARRLKSRVLVLSNQYEESLAAAAQSVSAFEALGSTYEVALSRLEWGDVLLKSGNPSVAREVLVLARKTFESLRANPDLTRVKKILNRCESEKERPEANSRFNPTSAERLLNAVVARDLLIHELVSVLIDVADVRNVAAVELSSPTTPSIIAVKGWTPEEARQILANALLSPVVVTSQGYVRVHWLEPEREEIRERAALLVETSSSLASDHIGLLIRIAQQGLELCTYRRQRAPKFVETATIHDELATSVGLLIGSSAMRQLLEAIHRIRSSNVTVLITGESGTGKELIARAVHAESARRDRAFVPFNCTAATRELADSLLFGHRRGSFTGAAEERQGVVRAAEGGTLFLDEIGDLSLEVQPKLLRFLQEGEVQPLGFERPIKVDVRVVAATNADLEQLVEQGRFREDLFHRLNVIRLRVPTLRERREEVPLLARHFLGRFAQESKKRLALSDEATDLLQVFDWPGNVRQLSNEMRRVVALAEDGATITHQHLSPEIVGSLVDAGRTANRAGFENFNGIIIDVHQPMSDAVSQLEREMLLSALKQNKGNISRTARQLGLTRRGLNLKRERLGIIELAEEEDRLRNQEVKRLPK